MLVDPITETAEVFHVTAEPMSKSSATFARNSLHRSALKWSRELRWSRFLSVAMTGLLLIACEGVMGAKKLGGGDGDGDGCVKQCDDRSCGDDSCGGVCGTCDTGVACNPVNGQCATLCGNGAIDAGETCDPPGSCPTACDPSEAACTAQVMIGSIESCSVACVSEPIVACVPGDGCCAGGCNALSDSDCDPVCGNGVMEPGETCGEDGVSCPVSCDDEDLCTEDVLVGSAETCDAACEFNVLDPCSLDQARGVLVGDISVNQGIRIPVRQEGALVPLEARNGRLIVERPMLVRADWVIVDEESFVSREIRAVLTMQYADGSTDSLEDIKETSPVDSPPYDNTESAYTFVLAADQVEKGMQLSVELFEVDESYREQPAPAVPARFPEAEGTTFDLGVDSNPSHIEVMIVPLYHDLGPSCPAAPDMNAMTSRGGSPMTEHEYFRQRLAATNPTSDVTVMVHDVVAFSGSAEESGDIFTLLRQVREDDGALDWQFYYALIVPCDDGPSFSGVASVPGHGDDNLPDRNDATRRTGWGVFREDGRSAGTFVHEIGHEQGRPHVGCGDPANPDPDYPNDTGDIEVYGWDIYSQNNFRPPSNKDYMSYCSPSWVSEYGWNVMEPWIEEISSWRNEQSFSTAPPTPMLYATIQPGKPAAWWTGQVRGVPKMSPSAHVIGFYSGNTLLSLETADREEVVEQPGAFFLAAPRPKKWSQVTHVVHSDGLSTEVIPASSIQVVR